MSHYHNRIVILTVSFLFVLWVNSQGLTFHQAATALSLGLTPSAITWQTAAMLIWFPAFIKALATKPEDRALHQWLVLGVVTGFIGRIPDNGYWGNAWHNDYLVTGDEEFWFHNGVYSNVPFRQILGILEAYYHVRGAFSQDNKYYKLIYLTALGSAFIYMGLLQWLKV